MWDIPIRGSWGVHQNNYRGNWVPQVPRAFIERYSKPGDTVLDPFVGGLIGRVNVFQQSDKLIMCDGLLELLDLAPIRFGTERADRVAQARSKKAGAENEANDPSFDIRYAPFATTGTRRFILVDLGASGRANLLHDSSTFI